MQLVLPQVVESVGGDGRLVRSGEAGQKADRGGLEGDSEYYEYNDQP